MSQWSFDYDRSNMIRRLEGGENSTGKGNFGQVVNDEKRKLQ